MHTSLNGLSWYQVALAGEAAFAMVAVGSYYTDLMIGRRRVKGTLAFSSPRIGPSASGSGVYVGVKLVNIGEYPIEVEMKRISTRIGSNVPERRLFDVKKFIVSRNGILDFDDHGIEFKPAAGQLIAEGFLEAVFQYGRPGRLRYDFSVTRKLHISFNSSGHVSGVTAYEAEPV